VNDDMPGYVVRRLVAAFNRPALNGSRILLLGVSYKRNTADASEAPAAEIATATTWVRKCVPPILTCHRWTDPFLARVDLSSDELSKAEAVVLITDHDDFDYDLIRRPRYVLDAQHRLDGPRVGPLRAECGS
jgi:UDP-N-acetyl-D-glucosamine dehydrogenase